VTKKKAASQTICRSSGVDYYRPLAALEDFHRSNAKWRLIVGSNRSGKTLAAAAEVAMAVTGRDPFQKYRPVNGIAMIIGLDRSHTGMLWRKLSLPGAFKLVKDGDTYRAVRPAYPGAPEIDASDMEKVKEWIDAPPLIPPEAIDGIAWADSAKEIPMHVKLCNGWQIMFVTSCGMVKQGEHYDLVWIDEQINRNQFFYEADRGLVDIDPQYKALGIWTASPQKQNPLLWELHNHATDGQDVVSFTVDIGDNAFVDKRSVEDFAARLTDDERAVRIEGQFAVDRWRIYPMFDPMGRHGTQPKPIPNDWTIYLALDPGTTNCATVFGAVPPDEKVVYIIGEILIRNSDAYTWARELANLPIAKQTESWIIDAVAGRQHGIGYTLSVAQKYMEAANSFGLRPRVFGPMAGFIAGCAVPQVRIEHVRRYLLATDNPEDTHFGVRLFLGRTTQLAHQISLAQFDENNPSKRIKGAFDLLDAFEYLMSHNPQHVARYDGESHHGDSVYQAFLRKRLKSHREHLDYCGVSLG